MEWSQAFDVEHQPTFIEISDFIQNPLWEDFHMYLQNAYQIPPKLSYSKCAAQPGWNLKYQKGGRSLCTLYPMEGFFIALVVIGDRETQQTELLLPSLSSYIQDLYKKTAFSCGGRWLMISVTNPEILQNLKDLVGIRVKPKIPV